MPVGLGGANEQKVGEDPECLCLPKDQRAQAVVGAGPGAELKMKSFLESECLSTRRSSCLSRGSQVIRIRGSLLAFQIPGDKCSCDSQSLWD